MNNISRRAFVKGLTYSGVGFALGVGTHRLIRVENRFDTIIKGGVIYNGEGGGAFIGEVGIKEGKIAAIAESLGESANTIIEAHKMALSPGFIDIHSHTDDNFFHAPLADSKVHQGITTEIGGNCGGSPFPSDRWKGIGEFYNALPKRIGLNYGSYVGQGDLRRAVVGERDVRATEEQLKEMKDLLAQQMEGGAIGLSCGLEYTPGSYATVEEIGELCRVVASYNGLFAIHMRNEDDRVEEALDEAIKIAKIGGVKLQISHLKAQGPANWHKASALLKKIERAAADGLDIAFDRYPYTAFSTEMTILLPLSHRDGSDKEVIARLKEERSAKEMGRFVDQRLKLFGGPSTIVITSAQEEKNRPYIGLNIEECCKLTGKEPWPFIRDLLIEERLSTQVIGFTMREENLRLFLAHPLGMPASDTSAYSPVGVLGELMPHPRTYGTFPRFIGKYCRDEGVLSLSEAIRKSTSLPASRVGLKNRGILLPGYQADIVIFNPETIIDCATFTTPHLFAKGIEHLFVNGVHTLERGEVKGMGGALLT